MKLRFTILLTFLLICSTFAQSPRIFDRPLILNGVTNQIKNTYVKDSLYINGTNILDLIKNMTNITEQYYLHKDATNGFVNTNWFNTYLSGYVSNSTMSVSNTINATTFTYLTNNLLNSSKIVLMVNKTNTQGIGIAVTTILTNWSTAYINEDNTFTNTTGQYTVRSNGFYYVVANCVGAPITQDWGSKNFGISIDAQRPKIFSSVEYIPYLRYGQGISWGGYLTNGQRVACAMFNNNAYTYYTSNVVFSIFRAVQ